jgi:hypothetical protein
MLSALMTSGGTSSKTPGAGSLLTPPPKHVRNFEDYCASSRILCSATNCHLPWNSPRLTVATPRRAHQYAVLSRQGWQLQGAAVGPKRRSV